MTKRTDRPRRATIPLAAALAAVLALTLTGCISLFEPPPDGAEGDLSSLADRIRAVEGVGSVTATLDQADVKDDPRTWIARIRVVATTRSLGVAREVRRVSANGVAGSELLVELDTPAGPHTAQTTVDALDPARVARADRFRHLPLSGAVTVLPSESSIELVAGVPLGEAVTAVRPAARGSEVTLSRGSSSVAVTPRVPGVSLASRLDELDEDPRVTLLRLELSDESWSDGASDDMSPRLSVTTTDVQSAADSLAATRDESADAEKTDRMSFAVHSANSKNDASPRIQGFLGLPLGSPRPATLHEKATRPLTSAELARIDLTAQTAAVRSFLRASLARTGVATEIEVGRSVCSGKRSVQATGRFVAPIFERDDDGQEPFDAVTAFWTDEGLHPTDRALGLDIWTRATGDGVVTTRIRGTAEGLSVGADSACVG